MIRWTYSRIRLIALIKHDPQSVLDPRLLGNTARRGSVSHVALPRFPKAMIVAHRKPHYTSEIRLVDLAKLGQFYKGNFAVDWHFLSYVEFVDGLETGAIVLENDEFFCMSDTRLGRYKTDRCKYVVQYLRQVGGALLGLREGLVIPLTPRWRICELLLRLWSRVPSREVRRCRMRVAASRLTSDERRLSLHWQVSASQARRSGSPF